ncbi:hypothetical protein EXE53_28285, partial [Halorubrum sp. SD626R]
MTATQPDSPRLTRRGLLRTTAVGIGAAAGVGALGSTARPAAAIDWGSIGKTAAIAAVSPPVALGWALREYEVFGSNPPAEGLTTEALQQQVYQTARTRRSVNSSTIIDNSNILDGIENTAYTDAKVAAIEELNSGSSESAVLDAANAEIDSYFTTVQSNFLKSWNESTAEWASLLSALKSHPDIGVFDVITAPPANAAEDEPLIAAKAGEWSTATYGASTTSYTLADGTSFEMAAFGLEAPNTTWYTPVSGYAGISADLDGPPQVSYDGQTVEFPRLQPWVDMLSTMETKEQNVRDGISTWVSNVYGDVQSGEIEITELITPRDRAAMLSDDESEAQAISALAALNIPIDPEREVTVTITETGATLS